MTVTMFKRGEEKHRACEGGPLRRHGPGRADGRHLITPMMARQQKLHARPEGRQGLRCRASSAGPPADAEVLPFDEQGGGNHSGRREKGIHPQSVSEKTADANPPGRQSVPRQEEGGRFCRQRDETPGRDAMNRGMGMTGLPISSLLYLSISHLYILFIFLGRRARFGKRTGRSTEAEVRVGGEEPGEGDEGRRPGAAPPPATYLRLEAAGSTRP